MTEHSCDPLALYLNQVQAEHPACQVQHKDSTSALITSAQGHGVMEVVVMVHSQASGGYSAWRYEPGRPLADGERPHAWVTLCGPPPGGTMIHHEVLCDPARFSQLLHDWLHPFADAPPSLVLPPQRPVPARAVPPATGYRLVLDASTDLLTALPDADGAMQQLQADVARVQLERVAQYWPRDARGRPLARSSAVLAAYGPATRKRQPCLLITSAMQSQMPAWRLHLSSEFLYNHRQQWVDARWRWSAEAAPAVSDLQARARALLQQGQVSAACELYGIRLGGRLRRLASGQAFQRFEPLRQDWVRELNDALYQLSPWRLAQGLQRVQAHLSAANRKPPKPGSWERKLFWFSGQRQQMRWGPGIRIGTDGMPELELVATADNEHFPQPDWCDM